MPLCICARRVPALRGSVTKELSYDLVAGTLLHVLLAHNQAEDTRQAHGKEAEDAPGADGGLTVVTDNAAVLLHRTGGTLVFAQYLSALSAPAIAAHSKTVTVLLQLAEVATCCEELSGAAGSTKPFELLLAGLISVLHVTHESSEESDSTIAMLALRVMLNVTTLFPSVVPTQEGEPLCTVVADLCNLMKSRPLCSDYTTCCAALLVNMLVSGANEALRWALLKADGLLETFVDMTGRLRKEDSVEASVCAGYLCVLLGSLSLDNSTARIRIITALTALESVVPSYPMALVIAVIQEFVMFSEYGWHLDEARFGLLSSVN